MKTIIHNYKPIVLILTLLAILLIAFSPVSLNLCFAEETDIYYGDSESYYATTQTNSSALQSYFTYHRKQVVASAFASVSYPEYYNTDNFLTNTCACVAGANIVGFYDRYYSNLIPDFEPGIQRPTAYIYTSMGVLTATKQSVINTLYDLMGVNSIENGASQAQYQNGLAQYVDDHGYDLSFSSVMSGTSINLSALQAALSQEHAVTLYVSGYALSAVADSDNTLIVASTTYNSNHIMVIFGMEHVVYYDTNDNVLADNIYLYVATGNNLDNPVYILDAYGTIIDAEATIVY